MQSVEIISSGTPVTTSSLGAALSGPFLEWWAKHRDDPQVIDLVESLRTQKDPA